MINLSQKEKYLLQDQKTHEDICIKKYNDYANKTQCPQLKQIFSKNANQEQQHLNTINGILNGQVPNMNQQQGQQNMAQNTMSQPAAAGPGMNQNDADLCTDILMTEKYVSNAYNTAIFEFKDTNIREALNHIQKEEQQHGEDVFNYMQSNGMYTAQ